MNKPYCEHLEDAKTIFDTNSLFNWLQVQAKIKKHELKYLLAHAEDGVIWGRFELDGTLVTQTDPDDLFPQCKFAKLRWSTLQQCRIFGEKAEVMLWKVDRTWKARLIKDDHLSKEDYIPEHQILWGTHGEKREDKGFTLLRDGQQGLRHAVPFTDIELDNEQKLKYPVRLTVHHYIDYDDDGVAKISLSRLVDLSAKKKGNDQKMPKADTLYERDFVTWCEDTAAKLRTRDLDNLDFDNLIEEIESLGRSDRRELKNRLTVLLAHILKRMYINSPENFNGWELTIIEQRRQIQDLLEESPSLKPYLTEILAKVYANALHDVQFEYKQTEFPDTWQFETETDVLLSKKYWEE